MGPLSDTYELIIHDPEVTEDTQATSKGPLTTRETTGSGATLRVGDRYYPCHAYHWQMIVGLGIWDPFFSCRAALTFESGVRLSIIWGSCTYSDNRHVWIGEQPPFVEQPHTVECYAFFDEEPIWEEPMADVPVSDMHILIKELNNWRKPGG